MVVDASVVAAWYLPSQATRSAQELFDQIDAYDTIAPAIFEIEVRNVMLLAERRGAQSSEDTALKLSQIFNLISVRSEPLGALAGRCLPLARSSGLKLYDAAYLDLALREGQSLASRDTQLLEAAERVGIKVFDLRS